MGPNTKKIITKFCASISLSFELVVVGLAFLLNIIILILTPIISNTRTRTDSRGSVQMMLAELLGLSPVHIWYGASSFGQFKNM